MYSQEHASSADLLSAEGDLSDLIIADSGLGPSDSQVDFWFEKYEHGNNRHIKSTMYSQHFSTTQMVNAAKNTQRCYQLLSEVKAQQKDLTDSLVDICDRSLCDRVIKWHDFVSGHMENISSIYQEICEFLSLSIPDIQLQVSSSSELCALIEQQKHDVGGMDLGSLFLIKNEKICKLLHFACDKDRKMRPKINFQLVDCLQLMLSYSRFNVLTKVFKTYCDSLLQMKDMLDRCCVAHMQSCSKCSHLQKDVKKEVEKTTSKRKGGDLCCADKHVLLNGVFHKMRGDKKYKDHCFYGARLTNDIACREILNSVDTIRSVLQSTQNIGMFRDLIMKHDYFGLMFQISKDARCKQYSQHLDVLLKCIFANSGTYDSSVLLNDSPESMNYLKQYCYMHDKIDMDESKGEDEDNWDS